MTPLLLPLLLTPQVPPPAQDPATAIRAADLEARIGFLASDALEGRESGRTGGRAAAQYFAREWQRLGLKPIGPEGSYLLPFRIDRELTGFNTAGLLPGTDPGLADQVLVIGGHHDHCGIGGPGAMGFPGEIHNGADDNASGSAGVAELAEWFVAHPIRRPILFMTFDAEERGLLGSAAFVRSGPLARDRIWAMINMDMIGRSGDGYLFVGGLGTAEEFHELLDPVLARSGLRLESKDPGEAPSDNSSFFLAGIPSLFFFTNVHEDYHMPSDDADKIDYPGEVKILELIRDCVLALDRRDGPLTFRDERGMAMPDDFWKRNNEHMRRVFERQRRRGRLGLSVAEAEDGEDLGGLRITRVREDSGAAAAGLAAGEILVEVAGRPVASRNDLRRALGGRLKGEKVEVAVRGADGALRRVEVELG
ncbi:MAG: M28 family peptidase [Planctomycetota bacterium]|nr:MAG: M28 family peptidase [Planctomycetota bacterium]